MERERCPLCLSPGAVSLHSGDRTSGSRDFLHCATCDMVFFPERFLLGPAEEKARYLQHNNDRDDEAYRGFLSRLYGELKPLLRPGDTGLDYGAGPGPALAAMIREDGFEVEVFDPYFHDDLGALARRYDFITCTETAEHFADPAREFDRLDGLLRGPGWLGLMTGILDDWSEFPGWYYHQDPTHIGFYSRTTLIWIASRNAWEALFPRRNVVLFRKTGTHSRPGGGPRSR